jgi:hypothetical protein
MIIRLAEGPLHTLFGTFWELLYYDGHLRFFGEAWERFQKRPSVQVDERDHELRAGSILVLNPDVRHNVRALEAAAMLLTVHLESEK